MNDATAGALDALARELRDLRAEVHALRTELRRSSVAPHSAGFKLLAALRDWYGSATFTGDELLADALLEADAGRPALRRALVGAGVNPLGSTAAVAIGVRLSRLGVERCGSTRRGAARWRLQREPSAPSARIS